MGIASGQKSGFDASPLSPCLGEDMWVAVSVSSEDEWLGLCRVIGQPELELDSRFGDREARRSNQEALDSIISSWTQDRDHYQVMHLLQAHGVPAAPGLKASETVVEPRLEARGFWGVVEYPEAGTYKQTTTPWVLSKRPRRPSVPAPGLESTTLGY